MTFDVTSQNHLLAREGIMPRWLLWVEAKEFVTGDPFPVGLWNGDDNLTFEIDGDDRVYQGAQGQFEVEPIIYATGTEVRSQRVTLSAISPEAEDLVRGYVVRLAPCELHLALMDPASGNLIGLNRMFKGFVNRAPISTPAMGAGSPTIQIEMTSSLRLLTKTLALKKTDQSQQLRSGDRARRYGAIAAQVETEWRKK